MARVRRWLRRYVPFEVRLQVAVMRRRWRDWRSRVRFARARSGVRCFTNQVCSYRRPILDYEGQVQFAAAKRHNLNLLASQLTGTLIRPAETFSIWALAPRPSKRTGYQAAAGFRDRRLATEVGGSTCLLSTVLYNVALLGDMAIEERHCHSIDLYGERRYFELGRDAAIEFGYLDLRFRNTSQLPLLLTIVVTDEYVEGALHSALPHSFEVEIETGVPEFTASGERTVFDPALPPAARQVRERGLDGIRVECSRRVRYAGGEVRYERLESSVHHAVPAVVACGAAFER